MSDRRTHGDSRLTIYDYAFLIRGTFERVSKFSTTTDASADAEESPIPAAPSLPRGQRVLGTLLGYNCRRAYLVIIERSLKQMTKHGLRPTSFSLLSLVHHEPGLNSRQVSKALGVRPPNLVPIIASLEARGLIERRPDPTDGRSLGLHPTADGSHLAVQLGRTLTRTEAKATSMLSDSERQTLIALLGRIWSTSLDK